MRSGPIERQAWNWPRNLSVVQATGDSENWRARPSSSGMVRRRFSEAQASVYAESQSGLTGWIVHVRICHWHGECLSGKEWSRALPNRDLGHGSEYPNVGICVAYE